MTDNSWRQRHVGLAVAYNAWHFYQATGDTGWLAGRGADLIIEVEDDRVLRRERPGVLKVHRPTRMPCHLRCPPISIRHPPRRLLPPWWRVAT